MFQIERTTRSRRDEDKSVMTVPSDCRNGHHQKSQHPCHHKDGITVLLVEQVAGNCSLCQTDGIVRIILVRQEYP